MDRRTFFGAVIGSGVGGGMLGINAGSVRHRTITPNRFTQETKLGDYFFYWTGWKQEISTVVNVGQWIAEPVGSLAATATGFYPEPFDREHPAFYAATTGTQGALVNLNYVMDLSYQTEFPLITDKSSSEDKRKAQDEALDRLREYIESWEIPPMINYGIKYHGNGHISDRGKLEPGSLIMLDGRTWPDKGSLKVVKHG